MTDITVSDDIEVARARAKALQARQLLEASMEGQTPDEAPAMTFTNIVNELNRGVTSLLPSAARQRLESIGVGVETPLTETAAGGALRYGGAALPLAMAAPAVGTVGGLQRLPTSLRNIVGGMADDLTTFATQFPGRYFGGETAAAAGAGAAAQAAQNQELGPMGQLAAETVGGLAAGVAPAAIPATVQRARQAVQANLLPFTEGGGTLRAARQMQERAGGQAEAFAERLASIPEGVTPAQWIGDERLLAQEARLLKDNPQLEQQVRGELQEARLAAQTALRDEFGAPRDRQGFEKVLFESVAAPGTVIEPGLTDEMLDAAYQSFDPLYDAAKGFDVPMAGTSARINEAINDPNIITTDDKVRASVQSWVNNALTTIRDKIEQGIIQSEDLIDLRSRVRDEIRKQRKRGEEDRADLLKGVETEITQQIEAALPDGVRQTLQTADSQYRKYKTVENAVFAAGDRTLTPDQLSESIRTGGLTTPSRYARGVDPATEEMRRMALGGRSAEEFLEDPLRAERIVRDMPEPQKELVRADFVDTLFNRAISAEATESGIPFISGDRLVKEFTANKKVMDALGMTKFDQFRLQKISEQIRSMGQRSPSAVNNLFEDGPNTLLQLGAAIAGAQQGQRIAGSGLGSSLVIAQYMSNRARRVLANLTSDEAARLMENAVTDPELYKVLLTSPTNAPDTIRQRAQYLDSWLLASAFDKAQEADNGN